MRRAKSPEPKTWWCAICNRRISPGEPITWHGPVPAHTACVPIPPENPDDIYKRGRDAGRADAKGGDTKPSEKDAADTIYWAGYSSGYGAEKGWNA